MRFFQFCRGFFLAGCAMGYSSIAAGQVSGLALPELPEAQDASAGESVVLNPINNYLREARRVQLPLEESIELSVDAPAFAYKIEPPTQKNGLWAINYSTTDSTKTAAVALKLAVVNFDEHRRVVGFEVLKEIDSLDTIKMDQMLWPAQPIYVMGSANPAVPGKLSIKPLDHNWSALNTNTAYTGSVALLTTEPVSKKLEFTWKAQSSAGQGTAAALWNFKLVSEPDTHYKVKIRSGTKTANAMGAKNENLDFQNLSANKGDVRISISPIGKKYSPVALLINPQEQQTNQERELDETPALVIGTSGTGVISHRDASGAQKPESDTWQIEVPPTADGNEPLPLKIQVSAENAEHTLNVKVKQRGRSAALLSTSARSEINSGPLVLQPGTYTIELSAKEVSTRYTVSAEWAQQQADNSEKEPNNSPQDANTIVPRKVTKGELSGSNDEDHFLLDTSGTGAAQYWRLIATGGGVKRMGLGKKYWIEAHKDDNNPALSMNYMLLLPGVHHIKLTGEGRYAFRAIPLGPPKPGFEIEPNDGKLGPSERLTLGETARGSLDKAIVSGGSDIDQYRFYVDKRGKYRITLVSPDDQGIQARLSLNGGPWFSPKQNTTAGSTLEYSAQLLVGEYIVELTNQDNRRALDEYSLSVEALPEAADVKHEPNDIVGFSVPLAGSGTTTATLGAFDHSDCYSLAPSATAGSITVTVPEKYQVKFLDQYARPKPALVKRDLNNRALWAVSPHEETLFLCIFRDWYNADSTPYTLAFTLGESTALPTAQLARTKLPDALKGGLNVGWHGMGARWEHTDANVAPKKAASTIKKLNRSINNVSPLATGVEWDAFRNDADTYRLRLAGDTSIPLAGIVVNTRTNNYVRRKTRHFNIMVSEDGTNFQNAMFAELGFTNHDQYLEFNKPVQARFIKFLPRDSFQSRSPHYARFQELKVIADPKYVPPMPGPDLASVGAGGHVVQHTFKPIRSNNADALDAAILDAQPSDAAGKTKQCQFLKKRSAAEWVIGFHHNRAARITDLAYTTSTLAANTPQFESLIISTSAQSPLGPWREVARWNAAELKSPPTIALEGAPWVRFIKFVATGQPNTAYQCPHDIVVNEAAPGENYRSILGEWSEYGPAGPFEEANPPLTASFAPKGGASADQAVGIAPAQTIQSSVKRERNDDWFLYEADTSNLKANSLLIQFAHPVSFKPFVSILDGNGDALQTIVEHQSSGTAEYDEHMPPAFSDLPMGWTTTAYTAWRSDDATFSLHIQEPPRNVVLTWDSSGSMGPQLPYIEMASRRWANYLKPDHEYAKIMKFAGNSQPEKAWANLPHMLQAALHTLSLKPGGSSDAENSLLKANELLAPRYGNHALVVTTDAEFPRSEEFWAYQNTHCSTVYGAGLAAAAVGEDFQLQSVYQDNFQNWVSACGGHYQYCDSVTCLEDFYEFSAQDIRKPKPYQIQVSEVYRAPPKPGLISVTAGPKTLAATSKALYVILDASGSMLQQLDGQRRIDIAKATLKKVTKENLGKHNTLGMRTFGIKVDECHHTQTLPIGKHTTAAIDAAIDKVKAVNNAKTPIAASLEAAAGDLENHKGEKLIVLLTDGEETCDGDSEAILNSLRSRDIGITMHIVGFALDDTALIEQFKGWATVGGGEYYDAGNQSALQSALRKAVTPRFEVKNSVGDIVLTGHIGDEPQSLAPGTYTVALPDYPGVKSIKKVLKDGGEAVVEFR